MGGIGSLPLKTKVYRKTVAALRKQEIQTAILDENIAVTTAIVKIHTHFTIFLDPKNAETSNRCG
jgi:hypothetical protein